MRSELVKKHFFAGLLTIWISLGPGICRIARKKNQSIPGRKKRLLPSRQMGEKNPELKRREKGKCETHLFSLLVQIS